MSIAETGFEERQRLFSESSGAESGASRADFARNPQRSSTTGTRHERSISVVVEPMIRLRTRL